MGNKMSLTEATMLALQGKLVENKLPLSELKAKVEESINVNVDETTNINVDETSISVDETTTVVETPEATIIIEEPQPEIVEPIEEPVVLDTPVVEPESIEVPVEGDETIIPEEIIEEPIEEPTEEIVELIDEETSEELNENKEIEEPVEEKVEESKKLQEEISEETINLAYEIAEEIEKVGCMRFDEIQQLIIEKTGITFEEMSEKQLDNDIYGCLTQYCGLQMNFSTGDIFTPDYAENNPDVLEESKLEEVDSDGINSLQEIILNELKNIKRLGGYIEENEDGRIAGEYLRTLNDAELNKLADEIAVQDKYNNIVTAYHEFMFRLEDAVANLVQSKTESKELKEVKDITPKTEKTFLEDLKFIKELGGFDDNFKTSQKAKEILNKLSDDELAQLAFDFSNKPEHHDLTSLYHAYIFGLESKVSDLDTTSEDVKEETIEEPILEETKSLKFNAKSFKESLSKYFKTNYKTVENIQINKVGINDNGIKVEAKLTSVDAKERTICLEMNKVSSAKSFAKYTLKEATGLLKENKQNVDKLTMMTFTNKDNVLECKYLICK